MTREAAIRAAMQYGDKIYMTESAHIVNGKIEIKMFSIHIDDIFNVSGEHSWEDCLKKIEAMQPNQHKLKMIAEKEEELAKLKSKLAPGESDPRD